MNCAQLRECVAPLLDGELEPELVEAAAEHLEHCSDCAALVEKLATVPLRPEARPPAEPDFWDAMDRALAEEATRAPSPLERLRGWFGGELRVSRGAALLYLLVLALALGWQLLQPPPPLASPEPMAVEQPEETAPAPVPAASPPPARRSQKLEKASYAPVQQTF